MNFRARKKDANHAEVVRILEAMGCSVLVLDVSTPGCPDLLVGRNGADQLVEVKPDTKLKRHDLGPLQVKFQARWRGRWVEVARNADDAVRIANGLGKR